MKTLITIPCLLAGGTEIQTLSLAKALVHGGHEVCVVCYYEFSHDMVRQFEMAGCRVVCLSGDGSRKGGFDAIRLLYRGLKNVVRGYEPDIVHVQYMAPGAIPIVILRLLGVKNIVATLHTAADIYPSLRLIHLLQRYFTRAFTCITQRAENSFFGCSQLYTLQTELKRHNHFTIYNTLPTYIAVRETPKEVTNNITIGVVSRLEHIKGMDLVVPAFARLKGNNPDLKLLIVGDGSQRELMQQQAIDLGVNESVEWAGRQSQSTLQQYYDKIDILLMPSRSEGFGLTAIEGMARGCVVVASNVGGLPEVVIDNEIGLLHDRESVESIAEKVESIISNMDKLHCLSHNAIEYVTRFKFEHYAMIFNDLYNKMICQ